MTQSTINSVIDDAAETLENYCNGLAAELAKLAKKQGTYGKAKRWVDSLKPDWEHEPDRTRQAVLLLISRATDKAIQKLNKEANNQPIRKDDEDA